MISRPIRQLAYFCTDIRAAALAHHLCFGSGPYFISEHIPLASSLHRGKPHEFDHSSAYGQWGEVMIEFVQQNNPGPSAMHDLYPEGSDRWGLHHAAIWVDEVDAEIVRFAADGFPLAQRSVMNDGFVFAFVDTSAVYGHMMELYAPVPALTRFYAKVAAAAHEWQGGEILIPISMA